MGDNPPVPQSIDCAAREQQPATMRKLLDIATESIASGTQDFPAYPLFAAAGVAVLVVEVATGRVAEANQAALVLLALPDIALIGSDWLLAFNPDSAQRLAAACRQARLIPPPIQLEVEALAEGRALVAALTTFEVGRDSYLLVRLAAQDRTAAGRTERTQEVLEALDRTPTGFVVTDHQLRVDYGNRAFLEMVRAGSADEVRGRSLAQWLALTEADLQRLREQMDRRQAASALVTTLHAGPAAGRQVQLTAIAVPDAPDPCWGFTLRVIEPLSGKANRPRTNA